MVDLADKKGAERREATRHKGPWKVTLTYNGKAMAGTCRDISSLGLGVQDVPPLPVSAMVKVHVVLAALLSIEVIAEVMRVAPDPAGPPDAAIMGLRFLRIDGKSLIALHEHLARR